MDSYNFFMFTCFLKVCNNLEVALQRGKYMDSQIIEIKENYGPSMCSRECFKYSDCHAVNYQKDNRKCELLKKPNTGDKMRDDASFSYAERSAWKIERNACWPNPCRTGKKCVVTYNGLTVCVAIRSGFLETLRECGDLPKGSNSRIYTVYPDQLQGTKVYCDMDTEGGNWTVFQQRKDATIDFWREWSDYKNGFGDVNSNYWIGNENLYILTGEGNYQLLVELEDWDGVKRYALYNTFKIGDSASKYTLTIGGYSGNAGDSLSYHNNMKFTTKDKDNDKYIRNCANLRHGAWWYKYCYDTNLNGIYQPGVENRDSVNWKTFKPKEYSLKTTRMMTRRIKN